MPIHLSTIAFFSILLCFGTYLIGDGWYSLLNYQKSTETFWRNNIFRWIRLVLGIWLIYMGIYFIQAVI